MKAYIGIDPGSKGYLVVLEDGKITHDISIADSTPYQIADWLNSIQFTHDGVVAVMEEIHAVFGSSARRPFPSGRYSAC